jgi:hypothetical protein
MILVASIFHTGTFFTMNLLPLKHACVFDEPQPDCKYQLHLSDPDQALLRKRMRQCKTIVPLRHPDAVASSWLARGLSIKKLEMEWAQMTLLNDVFFFPVDAEDRDARLKELSSLIQLPLATNWVPTNNLPVSKTEATFDNCESFRRKHWGSDKFRFGVQ